MKGTDEVIKEFNEIVNMTADELEKWLKSDNSNSTGWSKDEGDGESVGHDSGRQITEILKKNPRKDPEKYTDDQIDHMRKVVSYCKRHLAQEEKSNEKKPAEEVKKTKSYASLKNWGHDTLKKRGEHQGNGKEPNGDKEENQEKEEEEEKEEENGKQAGDKRKKTDSQSGTNKSQKTSQREEEANGDDDNGNDEEDEEEGDEGDKKSQKQTKSNGNNGNSKEGTTKENGDKSHTNGQPKKGPKPGDTVSWNWGNGQPEGKVLDVKGEKTSIQTKRGNEVSRDGEPDDPAVVLDTGKSKAIKLDHELN